jgi:hypothetical protein
VGCAFGDVTLVQKIESAALTGNCTIKVKGNLVRIDMPVPTEMGTGTTASIIDLDKGKVTLLSMERKLALVNDLRIAFKDTPAPKGPTEAPKDTGAQEKIGDWDSEIYEATEDGTKEKLWVAKDFPDGAAILAAFKKIDKDASSKLGLARLLSTNLPGVRVKFEAAAPEGKVTITVVSASVASVPASDFAMPAGFKKVNQGAAAPAKRK